MRNILSVLTLLLLSSCATNSKKVTLNQIEVATIEKSIELVRNEFSGSNNYHVCETFRNISFDKVKCRGTKDLIAASGEINNRFNSKFSIDLK